MYWSYLLCCISFMSIFGLLCIDRKLFYRDLLFQIQVKKKHMAREKLQNTHMDITPNDITS